MGHNPRVAVLSVHTSPMDQPGTGDSGGMNVYIRAVTERLAGRGIDVDVFTRCRGGDDHEVKPLGEGIRVVSIKAGPCEPIPKADIPRFLPEFLGGLLRIAHEDAQGYDVVHSHYWLSGWVGRAAKHALDAPLVSSFHTLGKVKNYSLARGEPPEPAVRIAGEQAVIDESDRILAPTPSEASQLVGLYRADADQIRIVPPGVDHELFVPRDRAQARAALDLAGRRIALYVGRLQAHKGPDVAVRTVAEAIARDPDATEDLVLLIVGGPSGAEKGAELSRLLELAGALGVRDRLVLVPPQPQADLADYYAAADVVLVPSRSESFGLVALEAQACGTPVVAARVGGLRYVVEDGRTGFLVEGHDPGDHAVRVLELLTDAELQRGLGARGAERALRFTWDATADAVLGVYREVLPARVFSPLHPA